MQWIIRQTVNLDNGSRAMQKHQAISPIAFPGNAAGHVWQVEILGSDANLSGATIVANFRRSDGNSVVVNGAVSGNTASVTFPPEVYAVPGGVKAALNIVKDGTSFTAASISFAVQEDVTGNPIDPGSVVPGIDDIVAEYANMQSAVSEARAAAAAASQYAPKNMLDYFDQIDTTINGVNFNFIGNGACAVSGTATADAFCELYYSGDELPDWVMPGQEYRVTLRSTVERFTDTMVRFDLMYTEDNGETWSYAGGPSYVGDDDVPTEGYFTIPETATGMKIGLFVASGNIVAETLTAHIYDYETDKTLTVEGKPADAKKTGDGLALNAKAIKALERMIRSNMNEPWSSVQANVRAGLGPLFYGIGDELNTTYTYNSRTYDMPWIVVAHKDVVWRDGTTHPGLILQSKYATIEQIQFDAPERTTVDLNEEPNALDGWYYWGFTGSTYTKIRVSTGDALPTTYYRVVKCSFNDANIMNYGYNRYSHSAHRQWLNSAADAGEWWTAQHIGDVAPSNLSSLKGFMAGLDAEFIAAINPIKIQVATATSVDGGVTDVMYDKFFLPSLEEIYGIPQAAGVEGDYWPYWKEITGLTGPSNAANNARKVPALNNTTGAAVNQRLRSAYRNTSRAGWIVAVGGNISGDNQSYYSYHACPACAIS